MRYFALFLMIASLTVFGIGCAETDKPAADPSPAAEEAADDAAPAADAKPAEEKPKEGSDK